MRRIYGDFSGSRLKPWTEHLVSHAIVVQQTFAHKAGKNGSDIALVIDAMDLLLSSRFAGFCLVASDSDFTRLALHIREQGLSVFSFGEAKTPEAFRQASNRFTLLDAPSPSKVAGAKAPATKATLSKPKAVVAPKKASQSAATIPPRTLRPIQKAADFLRSALEQAGGPDGWSPLAQIGSMIRKEHAEFDHRAYGHWKLTRLVAATGQFETRDDEALGALIRSAPPVGSKVVADG